MMKIERHPLIKIPKTILKYKKEILKNNIR